ncbi:MAG: LptF/LptG family permease [Spirochaetales bacterium]
MKFRLDRMLIREFLPVFVSSLLFCVLILQLVDLFEQLVSYIERDVSYAAIVRQQWLYMPQTVLWGFPVSLLFSVSFAMGSLYSNNELIAVLGAGRRLGRFLIPLLVFGTISGPALLWFEDAVVIESQRLKQSEQRNLLGAGVAGGTNTTVASDGGSLVFFTEYYARASDTMDRVTVVERDDTGDLSRRVTARSATWDGEIWELERAVIFEWDESGTVNARETEVYRNPDYDVDPEVFRRGSQSVEDMRLAQAREFVDQRRDAGLPYQGARTEYLNRYAFAMTPLIVTVIAGAVGSRLKRSILLLSILLAMSMAVVFYGFQFVATMMARFGYITPESGAFVPVGVFVVAAFVLLGRART